MRATGCADTSHLPPAASCGEHAIDITPSQGTDGGDLPDGKDQSIRRTTSGTTIFIAVNEVFRGQHCYGRRR